MAQPTGRSQSAFVPRSSGTSAPAGIPNDRGIVNISGRPYVIVQRRVQFFRADHPDWRIHTEIVYHNETEVVVQARVIDDQNVVRVTAHGSCQKGGFVDAWERAETAAIGRALSLIGYGSDELIQRLSRRYASQDERST